MKHRRFMLIVWPAFLLACVIEMLVFALVDPRDMQWHGEVLDLSREGVYTASFFVFWLLAMGSSALTVLLALPKREVSTPAGDWAE